MHIDQWLLRVKDQLEDYVKEERDSSYYIELKDLLECLDDTIESVNKKISQDWTIT